MKMADPWILGLSTGQHNGAACLCRGSRIVVAIQEERLTRVKRTPIRHGQRSLAVDYCLATAGITPEDLDLVVDCRLSRFAIEQNQSTAAILGDCRSVPAIIQIPHHLGHAFSAFCTSGFDESIVLVIDGDGSYGSQLFDWERAATIELDDTHAEHLSVYEIGQHQIACLEKHVASMAFRQSLGQRGMPLFRSFGNMFAAVAHQIFGDIFDAGKVMALAPYGTPRFPPSDFFDFDGRSFKFSDAVPAMFQHCERWPLREKEYADLAASVQNALEVALGAFIAHLPKNRTLCYAGGVALNSVANHNVLTRAGFEDVYVIPAAEDSGTAIGAAYYGLMTLTGRPQRRRLAADALGRPYSRREISQAIGEMPGVESVPIDDVIRVAVDLLCEGHAIGWFQGGSEFGPRALGHRSILCDPRLPDAKDRLNSRVKHREAFRPFAPAILGEYTSAWFAADGPNRLTEFMLEVCPFRLPPGGPELPAVRHVDGTGRVQTVTAASNPQLHNLLQAFLDRTGVPIILNTSMNVMGEPIVESPRDALAVLLFTELDYLIIADQLVAKACSFKSPLDLVPLRTSKGESFLAMTGAGAAARDGALPQQLATVLRRVDQKSSLNAIFAEAMPNTKDERERTRIASMLFRYGMINLGQAPLSALHSDKAR